MGYSHSFLKLSHQVRNTRDQKLPDPRRKPRVINKEEADRLEGTERFIIPLKMEAIEEGQYV
jgi:hypothetical protein